MDIDDRGLAAVQLKRALRGAAFLLAAILNQYPNQEHDAIRSRLLKEIVAIQGEIVDLLREIRGQ